MFAVKPIGRVRIGEDGFYVEILPEYQPAMTGLEGFSHLQIVWWFDKCDDEASRGNLTEEKPYTHGPEVLGTFATRSPMRPNPIAVTVAQVTYVDFENGRISLAYIDADEGTPVIDVKPYTPSIDRVEAPVVPGWCAHWPKNTETSGDFDWESEFNF